MRRSSGVGDERERACQSGVYVGADGFEELQKVVYLGAAFERGERGGAASRFGAPEERIEAGGDFGGRRREREKIVRADAQSRRAQIRVALVEQKNQRKRGGRARATQARRQLQLRFAACARLRFDERDLRRKLVDHVRRVFGAHGAHFVTCSGELRRERFARVVAVGDDEHAARARVPVQVARGGIGLCGVRHVWQ
jgi:hypothetical protein